MKGVEAILFESIKPTASTRINRRVTAEKARAQNQISPCGCCIHLPTLQLSSPGCPAPTRGSWILVNASSMSKHQSYRPPAQPPSKGKMTNYLWACHLMELRPCKTKNQEKTSHCLETWNWVTGPYIIMVKYFTEYLAKLLWNGRVSFLAVTVTPVIWRYSDFPFERMGEELQETATEKLQLQRLQRGNGSALCQVYPSFYSEFLEQAKQGTQMLPHPSSANEPLALAVFVWIVGSVLPSGTEHPRNAPDALTGCSREGQRMEGDSASGTGWFTPYNWISSYIQAEARHFRILPLPSISTCTWKSN